MTLPAKLHRLARDCRGAAIVEFGILAPAIIAMLLAVLQIGMCMQSYNALRSLSADVARYAMVQYTLGHDPADGSLQTYTTQIGTAAPYLLNSTLQASIADASTQRISGADEKTLTLTYTMPTLLDSMGLRGPTVTYTRPVFLTT